MYLSVQFNKKFGYYAEHHYRGKNSIENVKSFVGRTSKLYNRVGLNMFFTKYFEGVIGPALIVNFSPYPDDPNYESVLMNQGFGVSGYSKHHKWEGSRYVTN